MMAPCLFNYDPVIGCDGVEYANDCVAEASGVTSYIDVMGNETILEWDCNTSECVAELIPGCMSINLWDLFVVAMGSHTVIQQMGCNNIFEYTEGECEEVQLNRTLMMTVFQKIIVKKC